MNRGVVDNPQAWAEAQFGTAELGDARRTRRAVQLGAGLVVHPAASTPKQAGSWAGTKAAYRLFNEKDVTVEALHAPHFHATRQEAGTRSKVLMIQDTTELDFTSHRDTEGLGPIGNGGGFGFLMHNTLAVDPSGAGEVLGLANQMIFCRKPTPEHETAAERKNRERESCIWPQSVCAIGASGTASVWIHVCDRGGDNFEMFQACRETPCEYLIRMAQNRRAGMGHDAAEPNDYLLDLARTLPASGHRELEIRTRPKRKPRRTDLSVAFSPVTIFPPWLESKGTEPVRCWVVRVWETASPPAGEDPIEWILITSVAVDRAQTALEVAHWYSLRWLIEEYHKCLKTGCRVEKRQLHEADALKACVGMLAVVAVCLLQLKLAARTNPGRPATECAPRSHLEVLARYRGCSPASWTIRDFWREVAKLGGFLARKSDGEPGWLTLWRGWQQLDLMTLGAKLFQTDPQRCG